MRNWTLKRREMYESSTKNRTFGGTRSGWTGERSVPIISASGNSSPMSMAHVPVPVPMSNTFLGGFLREKGAK